MLLRSCGFPQTLPITPGEREEYTDPVTGGVFVRSPLVAQLNVSKGFVELMRDEIPFLFESRGVISPDGVKIIPGEAPTLCHVDKMDNTNRRTQVIWCMDDIGRYLMSVPMKKTTLDKLWELFAGPGKEKTKGFKPVHLPKQVARALVPFAVGGSRGMLLVNGDVPHFEYNVPTTNSKKKAAPKKKTCRVYCGVIKLPEVLSKRERTMLIRLAYFRLHGYAEDPFSTYANRTSLRLDDGTSLFVNSKSTQWWKDTQESKYDPDLDRLFQMRTTDMVSELHQNDTLDKKALGSVDGDLF
jgi:hypothetical protein